MKQITKVKINNFRNIQHAEYDLSERTAICGKNHIGKTNALQAIYWVLCDSMLENTNDFDTITPHDDNRAETHVELTFDDDTTFGKYYREKWTRTRGSEIETMTGHETSYSRNGLVYKTKAEATDTLNYILFEGSDKGKFTNVNPAKTMINPLYLFGQEEWKLARNFIINMVGNVSDDIVFEAHPEYEIIKDDLAKMNSKTDLLSKKYGDEGRTLKKQLEAVDTNIKFTGQKFNDNAVTPAELEQAKAKKKAYDDGLKAVKESTGSESPDITEARKNIANIEAYISQLQNEVTTDEMAHFEQYTKEREQASNDWMKQVNKVNDLQKEIDGLLNSKETTELKLNSANAQLETLKEKKTRLLDNYKETKAREFHFHEITCPNCNHVLNKDDEDVAKANFDKKKNDDLVDLVAKGRANNTEISRLEAEIEAYKRQLVDTNEEKIDALRNELASASQKANLKKQYLDGVKPYRSSARAQLESTQNQLTEAKNKLIVLQANVTSNSHQQEQFYEEVHKDELQQAQEILDKNIIMESAKKDTENLKDERRALNKQLTGLEDKQEALKQFILAKLDMINASAKKVFPDIDFVLIEQNIKEGSFNEVCYPLIKGKKTPFINGSNSERIMTGIAIINDIRKYLGLVPTPIVFDEGETLDSETIGNIKTDSQIITSIVDDDYAIPTAVSL